MIVLFHAFQITLFKTQVHIFQKISKQVESTKKNAKHEQENVMLLIYFVACRKKKAGKIMKLIGIFSNMKSTKKNKKSQFLSEFSQVC